MLEKILVGLDGSEHAEVAAHLAMEIAQRFDSELIGLNVFDISVKSTGDAEGLGHAFSPEVMKTYLEEERAAAASAVCALPGALEIGYRIRQEVGHPVETLLDVARSEQADLIVVGRRGMSRSKRSWLGGVAYGLVHHTTLPILLAHAPARPFQRILLAFDGSAPAQRAAKLACGMAQKFDACLTTLNVAETPGWLRDGENSSKATEYAEETRERTERMRIIQEALQEGAPEAGAFCGICVETGDPGETIPRFAAAGRYDLIVLGSRGLGGFERMLLGSVSHEVVQNADCAVLVTP